MFKPTPTEVQAKALCDRAVDPIPSICYADFVGRLIKPGDDLVSEATPLKMALNHLVCGFAGEVGELAEGIAAGDLENLFEEFGDFEFYYQDLDTRLRSFPSESFFDAALVVNHKGNGDSLFTNLVVTVSHLVDTIKRHTIYNKPLDVQKTYGHLLGLRSILDAYYLHFGFTKEAVIAANKCKLGKRYDLSVGYTDKAATDRADKNP